MSVPFLNHAASGWSEAIWRASWQGGLAVLLVWMLTRAWQSMPPLLRCWLWRFVFIKFAVAFFCPTALELAWLPASPAPSIAGQTDADSLTTLVHSSDELDSDSSIADRDSLPKWPTISAWLLLLWLAGVGMYMIRLERSWWAARRLRLATNPADEPDLLDTVARLSERMGMARPPSVRTTSSVPGPLVIGIFRPLVILPTTLLERGDQAELELVLAHELAHCRRWDLAWDWLPILMRALFFFHPLAWLARRESRLASEIACDELAIQDTDKPAGAYADVLLRVAMEVSRHGCRRPLAAIGAFESYQSLKRRLKALANLGSVSPRQLRMTLISAFAIALAMILPWRLTSQTTAQQPSGDLAQNASENGKAKTGPIPAWDIYRREYEIKNAGLQGALANSAAADKARDEARERWIAAQRLFNHGALSEEELRLAKLTWDSKTYEAVRMRETANLVQVEANVAKAILAASQQSEQALKEAKRCGEYEIKKAVAKAALADSAAADKTRDEVRELWIEAQRLFNQHDLSEEDLRGAKLTLDIKTREAISKRQAANKAEANVAKTVLATGQRAEQALKAEASGPPSPKPNQELKDTLDKNISINFSPGPLKSALDYLAERYDLHFQMDDQAFQKQGIKNIGEAKVSAPNAIGRLADVLQKLLDQANATYRVSQAGDSLIIVPKP